MRTLIFAALGLMLTACAHISTCGNAPEARTIYFKNSCRPRIDQVLIGSEMNIPENIKRDALANFDLEWIDPSTGDGRIRLGHYDLVPKSQVTNE